MATLASILTLAATALTADMTGDMAADIFTPQIREQPAKRHILPSRHRTLIRRYEPYQGCVGGEGWPTYCSRFAVPPCVVDAESHGLVHEGSHPGYSSGLYQIEPGTWAAYGGLRFAPLAYLASKLQQSIVATRIWDHGNGASNWTTAAGCGY